MSIRDVASAFGLLFGVSTPRPYGTDRSAHQGVSDGKAGVQWNAGIDRVRDVLTLGVNLEGMEYNGWPIGRLIDRELGNPELLSLTSDRRLLEAELWFSRNAWQASARPAILEQWLGPEPPVRLGTLDQALWRIILEEADSCLAREGNRRRRGKQTVTLVSKGQAQKYVTPHLQIKLVLDTGVQATGADVRAALERAQLVLSPVHKWMERRSAP